MSSSLTDVNGNASVTAVANAISGSYQVTANSGGLSATIDLANTITVTLGNVCIANNPTVDDLVEQYYAVVLQRPSDAAGKAFWMGEANRLCLLGIDPKQAFLVLGAVFFNSPEYLGLNRDNNQFVTDTYLATLSRLPDAGGLAYWSGQIVSGLPRSIVLNTFLFAPEFNAAMQSRVWQLFESQGKCGRRQCLRRPVAPTARRLGIQLLGEPVADGAVPGESGGCRAIGGRLDHKTTDHES